jgi:hypothetical protein
MSPLNDVASGELIVYSAGGTTVLWCPRCRTQIKRVSGPIMLIELFTNHTTCPHFTEVVARFIEDRMNANVREAAKELEARELQPSPESHRC